MDHSARFVDTNTNMYGVFGDPVRHSLSPLMLNRAFAAAGINAVYTAFHVTPERLEAAVAGVRALGISGVNVTIPHKERVMEWLDEIDPDAKRIGAVNTIVNKNGRLIGYNTDGIGYVRSLREETGIRLEGSKIVVIGAGGAARGIVYALTQHSPERIDICNRTAARSEQLAEEIKFAGTVRGMGLDRMGDIMGDADVVVNTTSIGMHPNVDQIPIDPEYLREGQLVSDLIYNPMTTRLLKEAARRGCRTHGGLGMFVYQGAYAFEYWTGQSAPVDKMRDVVAASFASSQTNRN